MDKKYKVFFSCLAGAVVLGVLVPYFAFGHKPSVKTDVDSKSWMSRIDGDTTIDMISMPGTHDSGALHSLADVAGKCQDISLINQLEIGARYLDIRLQSVANSLAVIHGPVNEDMTFEQVMDACRSFLNQHETETILLSIKEEEDSYNSTMTFEENLLFAFQEYKDIIYTSQGIPALKQVRGKVCLMSRYAGNTIGIDCYNGWGSSCTFDINNLAKLHVQDTYSLSDIDTKKSEIEACLAYSSNYVASHTEDVLTMNFFSGYLNNGFPPTYSVPVAKEINSWAIDVLPNYDATGIAIFDFLTEDLAKAVWSKNL